MNNKIVVIILNSYDRYLAAKTCYFGVGGGLRSFEEFVARKGVFDSTVCWTCKEGVQREILQLTFKNI